MTYHENPIDIPVGTDVAITYDTGNTYTGTVTSPGVMADTSGRIRSLIIDGDRVAVLGDAEVDRTDLDRLADATAEVERLQAVLACRVADVSSAITREGEAREREQDVTEALDDLRRKVGAEWVRLAEAEGWDMDVVERAIDHLDLEMPKPKPVTFSVTLDLEFTATPADRKVAERLGEHATIEQVRTLIEEALINLDQIDLDPDLLELDVWNSMTTEVRDVDVTD